MKTIDILYKVFPATMKSFGKYLKRTSTKTVVNQLGDLLYYIGYSMGYADGIDYYREHGECFTKDTDAKECYENGKEFINILVEEA